MTDLENYVHLLSTCSEPFSRAYCIMTNIEQKHGLYGYPPEFVIVGLQAIEDGQDPHEAIYEYVDLCKDDE